MKKLWAIITGVLILALLVIYLNYEKIIDKSDLDKLIPSKTNCKNFIAERNECYAEANEKFGIDPTRTSTPPEGYFTLVDDCKKIVGEKYGVTDKQEEVEYDNLCFNEFDISMQESRPRLPD